MQTQKLEGKKKRDVEVDVLLENLAVLKPIFSFQEGPKGCGLSGPQMDLALSEDIRHKLSTCKRVIDSQLSQPHR